MTSLGGTLLVALSLAGGWIGLLPIRDRLGTMGYHVSAFPAGVVLWPVVAAVISRTHVGFDPLVVFISTVGLLFMASAFVRYVGGEDDDRRVPAWSYAAWGGVVILSAAAVELAGLTSAAYDSVFHYEAYGIWLLDTGTFSEQVIGLYGALMPSLHAVGRFLGSEWTSTPYPVFSLHIAALLAVAIRDWTRTRLSAHSSWGLTIGTVALLVLLPRFFYQILYVHSHMISAAYLFLAVFALHRAYLGADESGVTPTRSERLAWLLVAGGATAGLALTRTDGLAYAVVPLVVGTLLYLEGAHRSRDHVVFVLAAAAPIAAVYYAAYSALGVWQADKLGGKAAAAVLTALAVAGVGALLAPHVPILGPWLRRRGRAIWLLAAAEAAGIGALVYLRPAGFAESARNMVTNLFVTGRNGSLWYVAVGVLVLSVVWGGHWAGGRRPAHLLVAIAQFFAIAFVVHGMGHPGRLSVADSFNRLSFHVVPLIYWYAATVLASVLAAYRSQHGEGIS